MEDYFYVLNDRVKMRFYFCMYSMGILRRVVIGLSSFERVYEWGIFECGGIFKLFFFKKCKRNWKGVLIDKTRLYCET